MSKPINIARTDCDGNCDAACDLYWALAKLAKHVRSVADDATAPALPHGLRRALQDAEEMLAEYDEDES